MSISENLFKYRKEKKFSRRELQDISGVSVRTIAYIEKKRVLNPRIETLIKLANALELNINDLIS